MKRNAKSVIITLAVLLLLGMIPIYAKGTVWAKEEENLVEDLNGLLVTANEEEDADSWRYKDGERIENGSEDQLSLYSLRAASGTASDSKAMGIDVSKWQGKIDWNQAGSVIDFAIIRCGYGSNLVSQDDAYFEANATACEELGISYGVYLYSYATNTTEAKSEAEHVLRLLENHTPDLPIYYDLEDAKTLTCTKAEILENATVFCETIEAAGYQVGIYSNLNWWSNYLTDPAYDSWDRWVAQWGSACTYNGDYSFWQYSDSGSIPGISGNVDCDYAMRELSDIRGLVYVDDKLYTGYYMDSVGRFYIVSNGVKSLKSGTVEAGRTYYSYNDGMTMTLAKQTVFANGKPYTGYYLDSTDKMYLVSNGTRSLKSGTIEAGRTYYSYNEGKFFTLENPTVFVNGKPYTGYYLDSTSRMYLVSNGTRSIKSGTVEAGRTYYSYNDAKTMTLAKQTVFVNGKPYTGYYLDSTSRMYLVSNGTRSIKSGTVEAGRTYYSYNDAKTMTLAKQTVFVNGKPYTGYYLDSTSRMYLVSSGTRSIKSGTVEAGRTYYSYNDAKTMTLAKQTVFVNGKPYTGYYLDSTSRMYLVSNGTRTLVSATLKKGISYYSYNAGKTLTLGKNTSYVKGVAR